jgi:hypothetical protein
MVSMCEECVYSRLKQGPSALSDTDSTDPVSVIKKRWKDKWQFYVPPKHFEDIKYKHHNTSSHLSNLQKLWHFC